MQTRGKAEIIIYNGIRFRRYPESPKRSDKLYFRASRGARDTETKYLHREIWKSFHGDIPADSQIHHKDNNQLNNDIQNLEIVKIKKHYSDHAKKRVKANPEEYLKRLNSARILASKWHGSKEGREWHKRHGKEIWENKKPIKRICSICGKRYETLADRANIRFCSNNCKNKHRRQSGIDNETRICTHCGKEYSINKYQKNIYCSRGCSKAAFWKSRR